MDYDQTREAVTAYHYGNGRQISNPCEIVDQLERCNNRLVAGMAMIQLVGRWPVFVKKLHRLTQSIFKEIRPRHLDRP